MSGFHLQVLQKNAFLCVCVIRPFCNPAQLPRREEGRANIYFMVKLHINVVKHRETKSLHPYSLQCVLVYHNLAVAWS